MRGNVGIKNSLSLKSKVPFITARFRLNFHRLWRMGKEGQCLMCETHSYNGTPDRNEKLFRPLKQTAFRYRQISAKQAVVVLTLMSHPPANRGEIAAKKCFGFNNKLPFVTDRFQQNLQWLWRMGTEYKV
jgi:hypothetical protein